MPLSEFVLESLLVACLREGPFSGPRIAGSKTALWKSLSMLTPEQLPDGSYRGDALYFFSTPVREPLMCLQRTLREYSRKYNILPNTGESLTASFIPRIVTELVRTQLDSGMSDPVVLNPDMSIKLVPLDADSLRAMMISVFSIDENDSEKMNETLAHTGQIVFEKFITEAYDMLSNSDQTSVEELIEKSEDPNEIMEFFERRLPDFDMFLARKVFETKNEIDKT